MRGFFVFTHAAYYSHSNKFTEPPSIVAFLYLLKCNSNGYVSCYTNSLHKNVLISFD